MKVKSITLQNFKKFHNKHISFVNEETGLAKDLVVLVGPNGSGKSTVLQAIAATLGPPTKRIARPEFLSWPGFDFSLVGNSWALPTKVDVDVEMTKSEVSATSEFFSKIPQLADDDEKLKPSEEQNITLTLKKEGVRTEVHRQYYQFRGREYAKQLLSLPQYNHDIFRRVGSIFWYTEHRTATSLTPENLTGEALELEIDTLRRRLSDWMNFHDRVKGKKYILKPGQKDLFAGLEQAYKTVFPTRHFEGPVPRSEIDEVLKEPWFFLFDGRRQYEISEMSGGERTTFPMLFDFANWNIHNSVILIDELELHLHPPMQQAILRAMQNLGENNQFIVTTHSDAVTDVVPENAIERLED